MTRTPIDFLEEFDDELYCMYCGHKSLRVHDPVLDCGCEDAPCPVCGKSFGFNLHD